MLKNLNFKIKNLNFHLVINSTKLPYKMPSNNQPTK